MGAEKWMEFFYKRSGGMSTSETNEALDAYRSAVAWRNDGLMAKSSKLKALVLPMRVPLHNLVNDSMQLTYVMSGGGSMYSNIAASLHVTAEEMLYDVLRSRTSSKVISNKVIDARMAKLISKALNEPTEEMKNMAKSSAASAPKSLAAVRKAASGWSKSQRNLLSGFLFNLIDPEPR